MVIKTDVLKKATNKVIKGAGFNVLHPLSSMLGIKVEDNQLKLSTTDMTNYLTVIINDLNDLEEMDITVDVKLFRDLINKLTTDDTTLTLTSQYLQVKADGTYKLELIGDEDGLIKFPIQEIKSTTNDIKLEDINIIYDIGNSAIPKIFNRPCLLGYYFGDNVISTDAEVIAVTKKNIFNKNLLLPSQVVELLTLNEEEIIKYSIEGSTIQFVTNDIIITGSLMVDDIEDFPIDAISSYINSAFNSNCVILKSSILSVLDRLSLFINEYDKNGVYLDFNRQGISLYSKKESGKETIKYIENNNFESFTCFVDIVKLKEQITANKNDNITLYYGNDRVIKMEDDNTSQIIALLSE